MNTIKDIFSRFSSKHYYHHRNYNYHSPSLYVIIYLLINIHHLEQIRSTKNINYKVTANTSRTSILKNGVPANRQHDSALGITNPQP